MEEVTKFVSENIPSYQKTLKSNTEIGDGIEKFMKLVMEKLKEALLYVGNLAGSALAWFDGVFPPETRGDKINHWFHVALPYIIAAVVFTVVVWLCRRCCCGGGGRRGRTMKAPGRNARMNRSVFEGNPKGYFKNLRAYPGDDLC